MRSIAKRLRLTHIIAAAIGFAILICASIASALGYHEFPAPFFWLDVAVVYFLSALPLAASIALIVGWPSVPPAANFVLMAVELAPLLVLPPLYTHARAQSDTARAIGLAQQSRLGEASRLIHRTIQLAPRATWNDPPLATMVNQIDEIVDRLEAAAASPLPPEANDQQRIHRAQLLAILDRTDQAIVILDSSPTLNSDADASNLRGTIYETRGEWRSARDWYAKSKSAWQQRKDSPKRAIGLGRAIKGLAFCERKLGHLREAEAAWHDLLALDPTADSHFLLAQFYEDTQQTAKARLHAQAAVKLDPNHYRDRAEKLLNNLVTSHFGCLGAFQPPEPLTR